MMRAIFLLLLVVVIVVVVGAAAVAVEKTFFSLARMVVEMVMKMMKAKDKAEAEKNEGVKNEELLAAVSVRGCRNLTSTHNDYLY